MAKAAALRQQQGILVPAQNVEDETLTPKLLVKPLVDVNAGQAKPADKSASLLDNKDKNRGGL